MTGVTIVTHGFGGSADDWVTQMGNLIAQQSGPLASQPRYLMTATDTGTNTGPITVTSQRVSGAPLTRVDVTVIGPELVPVSVTVIRYRG